MRNLGIAAIAACMLFTVGTLTTEAMTASRDIQPAQQVVESGTGIHAIECKRPECVMVPAPELQNLLDANATLAAAVTEQARQLKMLRESKGCAKLEVLPKGRGA